MYLFHESMSSQYGYFQEGKSYVLNMVPKEIIKNWLDIGRISRKELPEMPTGLSDTRPKKSKSSER